ncbi:hypothetical protein HMPREF0262_02982 [Clostridium sp. ATCC 29733]|nr:hypothetical protein HMPREF0262_02982 [Clostridium sp. ATCC 29733]
MHCRQVLLPKPSHVDFHLSPPLPSWGCVVPSYRLAAGMARRAEKFLPFFCPGCPPGGCSVLK